MPEIRKELEAFSVSYRCDTCGYGFMKPTGYSKPAEPPSYEHRCSSCGETHFFRGIKYPYIDCEERF